MRIALQPHGLVLEHSPHCSSRRATLPRGKKFGLAKTGIFFFSRFFLNLILFSPHHPSPRFSCAMPVRRGRRGRRRRCPGRSGRSGAAPPLYLRAWGPGALCRPPTAAARSGSAGSSPGSAAPAPRRTPPWDSQCKPNRPFPNN